MVRFVYYIFLGHATIGGLGPTSRQWGTTLDHIREVEVVLASGTITCANENQNFTLYTSLSLLYILYIFISFSLTGYPWCRSLDWFRH